MQEELDKLKFFAKPKLALDAVGGASAVRLSDALSEVGDGAEYSWCSNCRSLHWLARGGSQYVADPAMLLQRSEICAPLKMTE